MDKLTSKQIDDNKQAFIALVNSITVDGMLKKELLEYLEKSDFFTAPASTMFHCAYAGGLCEHSLNVYNNLLTLVNEYASHYDLNPRWCPELGDEQEEPQYVLRPNYSDDTLKIVALFHDISKANYYELFMKNVNTGKKDERGKDIWVQVPNFRVKDGSERFVGVNHEVNSYIIISRYIPLSEEELIAICNHHCCTGDGNTNKDLSYILDKHPLTTLLHMADFVSTFITEKLSHE